jgi:hypothetical protein
MLNCVESGGGRINDLFQVLDQYVSENKETLSVRIAGLRAEILIHVVQNERNE